MTELIFFPSSTLSESEVLRLLALGGETYLRSIEQRVSLRDYAEKLHNFSSGIVSRFNGDDVGYLAFYLNQPERQAAYITHVGIGETYRGRGFGRGLLDEACRIARDNHFKEISLEVSHDNAAARSLYEAYGFRQTSVAERSAILTFPLYESKR